eukprot:7707688-Ditylum_brightwellii.AAC.1
MTTGQKTQISTRGNPTAFSTNPRASLIRPQPERQHYHPQQICSHKLSHHIISQCNHKRYHHHPPIPWHPTQKHNQQRKTAAATTKVRNSKQEKDTHHKVTPNTATHDPRAKALKKVS